MSTITARPHAWLSLVGGLLMMTHDVPAAQPDSAVLALSMDEWADGVPAPGWLAEQVSPTNVWAEHGAAACFAPTAQGKAVLTSPPLPLTPATDYVLSFFYRVPVPDGGLRVHVAGVPGTELVLQVPYMHREGCRVEHHFRTPARLPAAPRLVFTASGNGYVVVDELHLTRLDQAWNRAVFLPGTDGGMLCRFTVGNVKSATVTAEVEMALLDFFNEPLWGHSAKVTLPGGTACRWDAPFQPGTSRRYRAVTRVRFSDGRADEVWNYCNPDVTVGLRPRYLVGREGWRHQRVNGEAPPAADGWELVRTPHWLANKRLPAPDTAYYQTEAQLPPLPAGYRLFLSVEGAALNPELSVNGASAARAVGREPLEADITALWHDGVTNTLQLRVQTAEAALRTVGDEKIWELPFAVHAGLLDEVVLELRPEVRAQHVEIETSVARRELQVATIAINQSRQPAWVRLRHTVYDTGREVLHFPEQRVYLIPDEPQKVRHAVPWPDPHLYYPHDPHLYRLTSEVLAEDGRVLDRLDTRFGFREVTVAGKHVLWNGRKAKFVGRLSAPHSRHVQPALPPTVDEFMNREFRALQLYQRHGLTYGREYPQSGLAVFRRDLMDELGFVVRASFELNMAYTDRRERYTPTPAYWHAMRTLAEEIIRRERNHPCIAAWDLENETFLCSTHLSFPELMDQYHRLRQVVRGLDRTRPVLHDSADPMADGDIISLHYPLEITRHQPPSPVFPFVPFEKGRLYRQLNLHPGAYVWNEDRPLMLGEDLIEVREFPQSLSLFADDEVYGRYTVRSSFSPAHTMAAYAAMEAMLQILGREYRKREVHVLTTWGCCSAIHTDELARDAIVVDEYHTRFFAGETVNRHLSWFHDDLRDVRTEITWSLTLADGRRADGGRFRVRVPGGEYVRRAITLRMPRLRRPEPVVFTAVVNAAGRELCRRVLHWKVVPRASLTLPAELGTALYDPRGETARALARAGVRPLLLATPVPPADCKLLIVGKNALVGADSWLAPLPDELAAFAAAGGTVLVLEQEGRGCGNFPCAPATAWGLYWPVAHIRIPDHPLVAGLTPEDLRFWRGDDHLVSAANWYKPVTGNAFPILDGGTMGGYLTSPLLELPTGRGRYLLCQLKLTSKLGTEPTATTLWQNIFQYANAAAPYRALGRELLFVGSPDAPLLDAVRECGATVRVLEANAAPATGAVVLAHAATATAEQMDRLAAFVRSGGTLWLHGVAPENAALWEPIIGRLNFETGPQFRPTSDWSHNVESLAALVRSGFHPLTAGLSNTDLYWLGVPEYDFYGKVFPAVQIGCIVNHPPAPVAGAEQLTNLGALQVLAIGAGRVILDAVRWPENMAAVSQRAPRLPTVLMNNLGITLAPRAARAHPRRPVTYHSVDLSAYFNEELNGTLPTGTLSCGGIPFQLHGTGRGAILLGSTRLTAPTPRLPLRVDAIPVRAQAERLHVLLTCFNSYESGRGFGTGEMLGAIVLHYTDGSEATLPIQQKVDCANLFETLGDLPRGRVAWEGLNPFRHWLSEYTIWPDDRWPQSSGLNRIYATSYPNPHAEREIASLTLVSANQHFIPIVFAVTLETTR